MRIRIHLNLKDPARAETSVLIQSESGAWASVAYAQELMLENVKPVVFQADQEKIAAGVRYKTPHAFLEGDIKHFKGRIRDKAPDVLKKQIAPYLKQSAAFKVALKQKFNQATAVNYNPRFAKCFYLDAENKSDISQRFVAAARVFVCGWSFKAEYVESLPMVKEDRCDETALAKTTDFERKSISRGRKTTEKLLK